MGEDRGIWFAQHQSIPGDLCLCHATGITRLGSLAVAINPVIIVVVAAAWDRKPLAASTVLSLLLCVAGVTIAAYPLVQGAYATMTGILILFSSMFVYSAGTLYFQRNSWEGLHL